MHEYELNSQMDITAASAFADLLLSRRVVAANPETCEEWGYYISPEVHAFIVAYLGDGTPLHAYDMTHRHQNKGRAFIVLLRSVASALEQQIGRA